MKKLKIGFLMDDIATIKPHKDTTFAFMLTAAERQHEIIYFTDQDLWLENAVVMADTKTLRVSDNTSNWFNVVTEQQRNLAELDIILMRKDPPFNMNYIYLTYLLELVEAKGVRVVNKPQSLRDANEKLYASWFASCCPPTLVSRNPQQIRHFVRQFDAAIIKPLDSMGGNNVVRVTKDSAEIDAINDWRMVQKFIAEIKTGDKRIILINGKAVDYCLARIPAENDFRGNLAQGARGEVRPLTARDRWLCDQVGPTLRDKGLVFVGLDVIGDFITEINVTSPTGIREIERDTKLNIGNLFFESLDA